MNTHKKAQKPALQDSGPTQHAVPPYEPALEEIRVRAYETYLQRGRIEGFDLEDWLQAEKELKENGNKRSG